MQWTVIEVSKFFWSAHDVILQSACDIVCRPLSYQSRHNDCWLMAVNECSVGYPCSFPYNCITIIICYCALCYMLCYYCHMLAKFSVSVHMVKYVKINVHCWLVRIHTHTILICVHTNISVTNLQSKGIKVKSFTS